LEETLGEGEFGKVVSARALNFRGRPGRKPWNKMEKGEKNSSRRLYLSLQKPAVERGGNGQSTDE
jgi:hypothetical protein